jgi:hypothetical protein
VASEFLRNLNHIVGRSLETEFGANTIVLLRVRVLCAAPLLSELLISGGATIAFSIRGGADCCLRGTAGANLPARRQRSFLSRRPKT